MSRAKNTVPSSFAISLLFSLIAITSIPLQSASAANYSIDQSQNLYSFSYNYSDNPEIDNIPLGQSFRPTFDTLDVVSLAVGDSDFFRSNGTTLSVQIREGSITGSILGKSESVFIPNGFPGSTPAPNGTVYFDFLTAIGLIPESTYVLEVIKESGDDVFIGAMGGNRYARGGAIVNGVLQGSGDLAFETGVVVVPEASTLALLSSCASLGIVGFAMKQQRRNHLSQ